MPSFADAAVSAIEHARGKTKEPQVALVYATLGVAYAVLALSMVLGEAMLPRVEFRAVDPPTPDGGV